MTLEYAELCRKTYAEEFEGMTPTEFAFAWKVYIRDCHGGGNVQVTPDTVQEAINYWRGVTC